MTTILRDRPGESGPFQVALTFDVERNSPSYVRSSGSVYSGMELMPEVYAIMRARGTPGTWYIAHDIDPANQIARLYPDQMADMASLGEIGAHFHFRDHDLVRTDAEFQRRGVGEATRYLRAEGHAVKSFRGGNLYLDASLFRLLGDLGYETDSTVLPGHRVTMDDGLAIDHSRRRSCEPYYPLDGDPWSAGGKGILEVPLAAYPLVSIKTPLVSVLLNYLVVISNLVLIDPDRAFERLQMIRRRWPNPNAVIVLSAHPHDFLTSGVAAADKLRNFDRFLAAVTAMPDASFVTVGDIRRGWVPPASADREPADRAPIKITTSTLRKLRNQVQSVIGTIPGI